MSTSAPASTIDLSTATFTDATITAAGQSAVVVTPEAASAKDTKEISKRPRAEIKGVKEAEAILPKTPESKAAKNTAADGAPAALVPVEAV